MARENGGIQRHVALAVAQKGVVGGKRDHIGPEAGGKRARVAPSRARAARQRPGVKHMAGRGIRAGKCCAGFVAQALAIFQHAQFFEQGDVDIAVGADAETATRGQKFGAVENTIAQVGFGDRAEPGNGAGFCKRGGFALGHLRGVNGAPARRKRGVVKQPFHRARTAMGLHLVDLGHLFGDVDVDGGIGAQRGNVAQGFGAGGAQAVRRHAKDEIGGAGRDCV